MMPWGTRRSDVGGCYETPYPYYSSKVTLKAIGILDELLAEDGMQGHRFWH
jgi:hypothetical protein